MNLCKLSCKHLHKGKCRPFGDLKRTPNGLYIKDSRCFLDRIKPYDIKPDIPRKHRGYYIF